TFSSQSAAVEALQRSMDDTEAISKAHKGNIRLVRVRAFAATKLAEHLTTAGRLADAEAAYGQAILMLEDLPIADLSTPDGLNDLTGLYDKATRFLNKHRATTPASAQVAYFYAIRRYEGLLKLGELSSGDRNGRALGDVAWYALFAREFEQALQ